MALLSYSTLFVLFGAALFCYCVYIAVWRLFFSPIAHFPGPKLAALTYGYEGYYDVFVHTGQYNNRILKMHEKYGPIIRISPSEVHIYDPDFYDSIYPGNNRRVEKWARQMDGFSCTKAAFGTIDHDLHQARRAPIAASFSKRAVAQLEPVIRKYLDQLISRLEQARADGKPVNLMYAFSALTGDIINEYSFGISQHYLDDPTFCPQWYHLIRSTDQLHHLFKHVPAPVNWLNMLPSWITTKIYPVQIAALQTHLKKQLIRVRDSMTTTSSSQNEEKKKAQQRTVFHEIFDSDLPAHEKTVDRIVDEGFSVTAAGTITTADTLAMISCYLLSDTAVLARLRAELSQNPKASLQQLEQLPYLTAVIKEGLRVSGGVITRLARIFPDSIVRYKDWNIPPGTPVSMAGQFMMSHPEIFPEPKAFRPERWLNKENNQKLEKYLVPFGKGTRQCLGLNLAWAELYITLAGLYGGGRIELELFETGVEDVEVVADEFVPGFRKGSAGVRVLVK